MRRCRTRLRPCSLVSSLGSSLFNRPRTSHNAGGIGRGKHWRIKRFVFTYIQGFRTRRQHLFDVEDIFLRTYWDSIPNVLDINRGVSRRSYDHYIGLSSGHKYWVINKLGKKCTVKVTAYCIFVQNTHTFFLGTFCIWSFFLVDTSSEGNQNCHFVYWHFIYIWPDNFSIRQFILSHFLY